jgi:2-(1,2-epoxy-1,2-dihydrophenyl)acetyl-CoA isomerase
VLGADIVLASDKARFVIAYDRIGASPDCGGTWFLPRKVGRNRAFTLMLLGQVLDAEAAWEAGIVTEIVPGGRSRQPRRRPGSSDRVGPDRRLRTLQAPHRRRIGAPLAEHLEAERRAFLSATGTADFREGVAAFLGKRDPVFRGG